MPMKPASCVLIGLTFLAVACHQKAVPGPAGPIDAKTGVRELVETSASGTSRAMTETEYQQEAQRLSKDARFVPITKKPAGLSARAKFGTHLILEERHLSWAIDGDAASGYIFYGDFNGNGDLGDDGVRRFVDEAGKPTLRQIGDRLAFKLQLVTQPTADKKTTELALARYTTTRRRGQVSVSPSAAPLTFRMTGPNGLYNQTYSSISFDFNNDGKFDAELERYEVPEKFVNISGTTYEFSIEPHGDRVTFTPVPQKRADRVPIKTGYPAPDFTFADINGAQRRLSEFRGKVVLLDFWGVWCGPCVAAVPRLVELYTKYHPRGFEILGIEANDTREKVAAFIADKQMRWAQTLEHDDGPITRLYRVTGWPSAFLVGPDGTFVVATYLGEVDLGAELAKLFPG